MYRFPTAGTALSALRSKLSLKSGEILAPHDERLSLAKLWIDSSPAAEDLFDIWGAVNDVRLHFGALSRAKHSPDVYTSPRHVPVFFVDIIILVPPPGSLLWCSHHQDASFSTMVTNAELLYQW